MIFGVKIGKVPKLSQNRLKMERIEYFLIRIDIKRASIEVFLTKPYF
jgi:hypothetical protein